MNSGKALVGLEAWQGGALRRADALRYRGVARVVLAAAVAVGVAGCGDPKAPPHYAEVCTKYDMILMPMYFPTGPNGSLQMMLMPQEHCVQTEMRCVWGAEYKGPTGCLEYARAAP